MSSRPSADVSADALGAADLSRRSQIALTGATIVGVVLGVASIGYPMTVDGRVGAGLFPTAVALLVIVCSIVSMVGSRTISPATEDDAVDPDDDRLFGEAAWRIPALVGILIVYILVVDYLGHLITSCLLAWASLWLVGGRRWWQQILFGLALGIGTAEVFARLGVHLPLGVLLT